MRFKLFENFERNILDEPYVREYKGKYYIPRIDWECFSFNCLKKFKKNTLLMYSTLMRFYLYVWLLKYNGDDEYVLFIKDVLSTKNHANYDLYVRIVDQIASNYNYLRTLNRNFGLNVSHVKSQDIESLSKLSNLRYKIFTPIAFRNMTTRILNTTLKGDESENKTLVFLNKIWSGIYKVKNNRGETSKKEQTLQDKKGTDLWRLKIDTGDWDRLQVKYKEKHVNINVNNNIITIEPTGLQLHNYKSGKDKLNYDHLLIYDKYEQKLYKIHGKAIDEIIRNDRFNKITIILKNWDPKYGALKIYNLPKKYC